MIKQESIRTKLYNKQLNWYGHITETGKGKRKSGRSRKTWMARIEEAGTSSEKALSEMKTLAWTPKRIEEVDRGNG